MKDASDSHWGERPLGEVCDILDRLRKPITKRDRVAGDFPYYGATGILDYVDGYLFDEPLVLLGEDGAKWEAGANSAFLISGKTWVNNHAHVIRPHRDKLSDEWLIYYLNKSDLMPFVSGMTVPKLNQGRLREIPIPLPPLDEQKRIVAVLDEAFAALDRAHANAEANLLNARELFESTAREAFRKASSNGTAVTLGEVTRINSKLVDPRKADFIDLPHLGAGNMITGSDELVGVKTAREEKLKSGKHLFDEKTVLYSKIRPYLRKAARPSFSGLCSADVYPLTPNETLDRDFLFHLLLAPDFTDYAISGSDRAGMPKVNRKHLFAFEFSLPSIAAQRDACLTVDKTLRHVERLKANTKANLDNISELRQSLLQKAFAGDLT